jgi:large subunit ribosomal protein L13
MSTKIIVDATGGMLGRIASYVAKQALLGKEVFVVNCNGALVSGNKRSVIGEYIESRVRGGSSQNGPHFPKSPERIMKRTIRGMLSYKQGRGEDAFSRIKCYNETPAEFKDGKKITLKKEVKVSAIVLSELGREL